MKFLSIILFLILPTSAFAAGGGGGPTPFVALNPPIIVNIVDGEYVRHMQVIVELKMVNMDDSPKVEMHKGPIRHELILLLSSQDMGTISSSQGKEQLRKDSLEAIQKVMQELEGDPLIEAVYFTNFIIQ